MLEINRLFFSDNKMGVLNESLKSLSSSNAFKETAAKYAKKLLFLSHKCLPYVRYRAGRKDLMLIRRISEARCIKISSARSVPTHEGGRI